VFQLPPLSSSPAARAGQCYLPVYWSQYGQVPTEQTAFLLYPDGSVTSLQPVTNFPGGGQFWIPGATYDRMAGRWLPVGPEAVAPDGVTFAYADYDLPPSPAAGMSTGDGPHAAGALATTGRVHLVDARTGADRILFGGSPTYEVIGYTADGIYLQQVGLTMDGPFASGLFLLKPSGGVPAPVAGGNRTLDRAGWDVIGGAAWGVDYSTGGGLQPGNQLVRLDLTTGAIQVWLTAPEGTGVTRVGTDSKGSLLVLTYSSGYSSTGSPPPSPPTQLLKVSAPGAGTVIFTAADPTAPQPSGPSYVDANGAWLSGGVGAIWLDVADALKSVSVAGAQHMGVGGTCA